MKGCQPNCTLTLVDPSSANTREYTMFQCSPEISTSLCLLSISYETFAKVQLLWFEGCVVHPFLEVASILIWIRVDHQKFIYLAHFMLTFPFLPSLFPPPSCCLHPVTLRCLVLGFHQRVPREAASWNPFPICCSNIPQISMCEGFLKIFNCPAITYHLRNRDKVVSFSSS